MEKGTCQAGAARRGRSSPPGAEIRLSPEHTEHRWAPLAELGGVQQARARAALDYTGTLHTQVF